MSDFQQLSPAGLEERKSALEQRYAEFQSQKLALDMTRGKPAPEQLDLANEMLTLPGAGDFKSPGGTDCRNYGGVEGLPELRALFAEILEVPGADQVIIGGNASLTMMHDTVVRALLHGVPVSDDGQCGQPWIQSRSEAGPVKFLCPSPGYDRHFSICQHFGIEMVTVGMNDRGPDMDAVERLVAADASIKGIWCVPKYSNPTGVTYADEVVDRLARMKTAAPDFRIFWDNAYAVHDLTDAGDKLKNLYSAAAAAGHANRVLIFASTSKVTLAGAGLAAFGASPANIADAQKHLSMQTIGPDKVNQLRHLRFLKDMNGVRAHMRKHAALIQPKFSKVLEILENELAGTGVATWTRPNGGYFISLDTSAGCATAVVKMAGEAGVKLTGAGATFPYKKDPNDANIRLAPTLPSLTEIAVATEVIAVCIQIVAIQKLLP